MQSSSPNRATAGMLPLGPPTDPPACSPNDERLEGDGPSKTKNSRRTTLWYRQISGATMNEAITATTPPRSSTPLLGFAPRTGAGFALRKPRGGRPTKPLPAASMHGSDSARQREFLARSEGSLRPFSARSGKSRRGATGDETLMVGQSQPARKQPPQPCRSDRSERHRAGPRANGPHPYRPSEPPQGVHWIPVHGLPGT
jgi:hypothetical protein